MSYCRPQTAAVVVATQQISNPEFVEAMIILLPDVDRTWATRGSIMVLPKIFFYLLPDVCFSRFGDCAPSVSVEHLYKSPNLGMR